MNKMKKILIFLMILSFLSGCAHVISPEVRKQADRELTPDILFINPEAYIDQTVIIGGVIVSSRNTDEGTYLEVLQKPLDYRGRPKYTDISHGRFIVFYDGFLDSAVYSMGKEITVAGEVLGKTVRPLGEMLYPYPLIRGREIHLFEPRSPLPVIFSIGVLTTF